MSTREVILDGGSPWGFRMHGGADIGQPLRISRVNPGSKAAQKGVREGDIISSINGQSARSVTNSDAHALLRNAGHTLQLGLNQECGGSPKRRIYRNVQQDSRTETIKRSCTSTSSSSTVKISTGTNGSPSGAEKKKETSAPIQNGVNKSTSSSIEIKNNNNNSKGRRRRRQHSSNSDKREELNTIVEQSQEDSNMSGENLQTDVNISQTAVPGDKSLGTKGNTSMVGEEAVGGSRSRGRRLRKSRANRRKFRESGDFGKVSGQDATEVTVIGAIEGEVAAVVEQKGSLVPLKKDQVTEKVGEPNSEKVVAREMFVEEDVSAEDITKDRINVSVEARNPSIDVNTICDKGVKDNNSTVRASLSSQNVLGLETVLFSESKNVTSKTSIKLNYDMMGNLEEDFLEKQLQKQDSDLDFLQNEVVLPSDSYMYSKNNNGQNNSALKDCDKIKDISESCFGKRVDISIHQEMTPSSETQQVSDILENNELLASVCDCTVKNNEGILPKKPQPNQDSKTISRSSFQEIDLIKCNEKKDKDSIAINIKKFSSTDDRDKDSELMENYKETLIPVDISILLENKEDFAKEESKKEKGDIIKIDNWLDSISKEVEDEHLLDTKEQLSDLHDKGNEIIPSTFEQNKKLIGNNEENQPVIKSGVSLASSTSTERTKINTNEHLEQIRSSGLNESQGEINVITVEETFHTSRERERDGTARTTSSGTDIISGHALVDCEVEEGNISSLIENDIIEGCLITSNVEYPIIETATTEIDDVLSNAKSVEGVQHMVDIQDCQEIVDQIITNSTILAEKETRETTSNVSQEILSTSTVQKVPVFLENQISLNEEINDHLKNCLESFHILENEIFKLEEPTAESCTFQVKDLTVEKNESDSINIVDCNSSSNVTVLCETLDEINNVSPNCVKEDGQLFQGETTPSECNSDHTSFYKAQISNADHTQHLMEHTALEISENKEEDWQVLGESDYSNAKPQLQEEISVHIVLTENNAESNKDLKLCDGVLSSEDQELLEPFPPMPADEEENLRRFLQTLNLENYSDVPQENKTTALEYKTVPEDPVLTKRGKNRHALETYFMPCQNPRFLGVILEESNENNEGDKLDENIYEEEIKEYPDKEHDEADDTKVEHRGWEDVIFDPVTNDVVVISRIKKSTVRENTPQRTIFVEYTEKKSWSHNRFDVWDGDGSFYPEEPEIAVKSEVVLEDTEDKEKDTPWERSNGKVWDDAVYFSEVQEVAEEDDVCVKVELAESSDEGEATYTRGKTQTREHEVEIVFLEDTSSASSVTVTVDDPGDDADIEEEEMEDTIDQMNVVSVIRRCQNQSSTDEDPQLNDDFDKKDTILDGTKNVSCDLKTIQNKMINIFDVDSTNPMKQIFEDESYNLNSKQLQGTNNTAILKNETGNILNYDNTSIEEIKYSINLGSSIDKQSTSMEVLDGGTNYVEKSPLDISNNIESISLTQKNHDLQSNLTHEYQQETQDNNKQNTKIVDFFKRLFVILPKADNNNKNMHDVLEELIRDPTSPLSPTTRGNITILLSDNATRNISNISETSPQDTNNATKMEQPEIVHDITEIHCQESSVSQHNKGYITPSEKSPDEGNINQKDENPIETENLTELTSPISHSRQNSSSSEACSHSTTVFNPSKSPWSSERDITDLETDNHVQEGQEYDPTTDPPDISLKNVHVKPLKELALSKVVSLPYGVDILVCLGISEIHHLNTHLITQTSNISVTKAGNTSDEIEEKIKNNNNNKCTIQSLHRKKQSNELCKKTNTQLSGELSNSDTSCVDVKSQEYPDNGESNKHSPSPPPVPPPPHISRVIDKDWIGMPTRVDPRLLVCLSPSQRRSFQGQYVVPTPDEAESLLDLHRKFVERRGYHEGAPTPPPNRHKSKLIQEQLASSSCTLNLTKNRDKMSRNKERLDLENGEIINNNPHSKQSIPSEHPANNSNLIDNGTNLSSNSRYQDKKLNPSKCINQSTQPSIVHPISNTRDEDKISIRAEEKEHKKRQVSHPCENSSQQKEFKCTDVTSPRVKIHTAEEEERTRDEDAGERETERSRLLAIIRDAASHRVEERRTPPESKPENRTHILNRQETHRSREDDGRNKTIDGMLSLSNVYRNQENVFSSHQQMKYTESIDTDQYDYRISNRRSWAPASTQLSSGDSYQQKENKQTTFQTETNRRASTICSGPYYASHDQDFEILYQGISPVSSPLPGDIGNKERLKVKLLSEWLTIARGNEASKNVSEEDRNIFFVGSHSAQKSRKRSNETVNVGSQLRSQTSENLQTSSEVQQKNSSSKQTNELLLGKIQTKGSQKEKEIKGTSDDINQHNSPKVSQTNTSEDHQKLKELIVQRRYSLPKNVNGNKEEQTTQLQQEKGEHDRSKPVQLKRFSLPPERENQTEKEAGLSQERRHNVYFELPSIPDISVNQHDYNNYYNLQYRRFSDPKPISETSPDYEVHVRRRFDADKYIISKKGDIAIIQSEVVTRKPPCRSEKPLLQRPNSMPGTFATGGEIFRQQMYLEYMSKVAERAERRKQKVIRISGPPGGDDHQPLSPETEFGPGDSQENLTPSSVITAQQLEDEFMGRVRERMDKLGINYDEEENDDDGRMEVSSSKTVHEDKSVLQECRGRPRCKLPADDGSSWKAQLPKHLQEFLILSAAATASDDVTSDTDGSVIAPTFKATSHKPGVWSPSQRQTATTPGEPAPSEEDKRDDGVTTPVWTPKSSPLTERKEFRPVSFESPTLPRKNRSASATNIGPFAPEEIKQSPPSSKTQGTAPVQPLWQQDNDTSLQSPLSEKSAASSTLTSTFERRLVQSQSAPASGLSSLASSSVKLPRAQNPTITLLQKAREGQLPRGAHYLDHKMNSSDGNKGYTNPNEILYTVNKEYEVERDGDSRKKVVDPTPRKYEGIGPTTRDGVPIVLRSEIKDMNQAKWYKRMYDSLHRAGTDGDYVTIRYKPRKGHYPYTSAGGYLSEPDHHEYDSDIGFAAKYATLDRRRIKNKENDFTTNTLPRSKYVPHPNSIKHATEVYKNQPGRIEDYMPGRSSISEKETKQWWDEVLDIFDGWLDTHSSHPNYRSIFSDYDIYHRQEANERRTTPSTPSGKSFMTHALKESGYESDSTLVFKRRDENLQNQLSPAQHKIAYNTIQKGGEVPLHGLRKPAPERPKEISEIEYFPISPHLTRIRVHKQNITPLREILCYPVTTHVTNPPPIFSTYKRTAPSYIHVSPSRVTHRRPPPPPRISSHNNSTLRLWSGVKVPSQTHIGTPRNRHESCHTPTASDANIRFLRERLSHKLGVASKESNRITRRGAQEITNPKRPTRTLSSSPVPSSWSYSTTSSPTAMFRSRSTPVELPSGRRTKEDTTTALRSRRAQQDATSARLSRSPDLYSPSQARRTFQKTQEDKDTKQRPGSRSLPPGTVIKSSTTLYSSARNSPSRRGRPEEKSLRVTVAISAKGRELLRSGAASTSSTNISKSPTLSPTGFRQSVSPKSHTPLSATSKVRTKTSTSPVSTSITKRPCRSVSRESSCSDHVGMSKTSKHNPSSILSLVSDEGNRRIKRSDIIESRKRLKDKSSTSEEKPQSSLTGIKPALKKSFSSISSSIKGALKEDKLSTDTFSKKNKKNRSESNGGKSYGNSPGKKNGPTSKTTGKSRNGVNGGSEKRKSRNEKKISGDPVSRTTTFTNLSAMPLNEANLNQFGNFEDLHTTNNQFGSFENLSTVNRTQEQPSPLKSDSFFQHLLLRGMPSPTPSVSSSICRTSSVLEKARRFYEQANVSSANKIPYKSEPYLGLINVYLAQKRPVTESKFRSLDRDKRVASRSPSPSRLHSRRILPFISRSNIKEDNESVRSLVSSRSRTPESIKFTMKHRSSSEPPIYPSNVTSRCQSPTKDVIQKPLVKTAPEILESPRTRSPSTSPSPIRSPACRKIRSARVQTAKTVESIIGVKKKPVLRAKSAGDVEEVKQLRKKLLRTPPPSQAQSTSSLNLSHITDHGEYQSYVMELFHSTKKSERFKDLHKFYASLERMGQLERTTSIGDLRPRLKGEEIIDYDRWKQLRTKEKAEEELKVLYSRLKEAQKERDFLFRPHDAESLRWKGECDRGLRCREKSVEDLRQQFHKFSVEDSELEATRRRELEAKKDVYKPLWRGSSVLDLATSLTTTKASHRGRAVTADSRDSRQTVLLTRPPPPSARDLCRGIGSRLWSSLSMDQVNALKNQLSEIYSSVSNIPKDRPVHEQDIRDQFEIAVTSRKETSPKKYYEEDKDNLHVRCNSLLTRDQLYSPLVRRREARRTESLKADSISSLPHWKRSATKTIEDITIPESERLASPIAKPLSESEKKRLSLTLSQEVLDRVTNKGKKPILSLVGAKETRGAIAAEAALNSRRKSPTSSASPVLSDTVSPRTCYSLEMSEEDGSSDRQATASTSLAHRGKNNFLLVLTPSGDTQSQQNEMQKAVEEWANSKPYSTVKTKSSESGALVKTVESDVRSNVNGKSSVNGVLARLVRTTSTSETESASSETSTKTVIHRGSKEEVQQKVYFFERRDEEAEQDKRWARGRVCCSASDVRYSHHPATAYATRAKSAPSSFATSGTTIEKSLVCEREKPSTTSTLCPSQSYSDFKELFGEKHRMRYATAPLSSRSKRLESVSPVRSSPLPIESSERKEDVDYRALSQGSVSPFRTHYSSSSTESLFHQRSRSASPDPTKYWRAYLRMVKRGDVRRLKDKFESLENLYYWTYFDRKKEKVPPKRYRSDPELARNFLSRRDTDAHRVVVRGQEVGDVRWLRRRYESSGSRGRSRIRKGRVASPVLKTPLRAEDRFMPHINVISKLATLQQRSSTVPCRRRTTDLPEGDDGFTHYHRGEVGRICDKFEHLSLLGQMFTSTPDVRELRDIAPYLGCQWVAHKYPDNSKDPHSRSLSSPELRRSPRIPSPPSKTKRPASSSPTRRRHQQPSSILKSQQSPRSGYDVFANQQFDPSIHRPLYRYQPAVQSTPTSWWVRQGAYGYTGPSSRPTVTFKEPVIGPVPRDYHSKDRPSESPHRYVESEVTIHYRSPVRSEAKEVFSEEELARRQAEAMRRIYQEERRRKYLQELQDMNSRRHTDNFTPSQKSPISLNRYDDFLDDISKSKVRDQTPEPKLVARALYNFAGQTSRELSFRRGDIIFVRRQIDKNWYEGEHNAMIGLFPFNYIEIIPYDGIRTMPKRPSEGQARAKFNFIAQTHLELSLIKGEMVVLTRRVDDNWFEGRIGAKKGIFPVSYVEVLQEPGERPLTPSTPVNKPVTSPASHSVLVNGSSCSKQLKYPHTSSYYKTSSPGHYATLPRQSHQPTSTLPAVNQTLHIDTHSDPVPYRALYNYRPQNDDELELVEGDTVYVMEKCDDGWYVGSSERSGYFGTFPGNYVERI